MGGGGCGAVALQGGLNVRSIDGDTVGGVRHVAELLTPTPLRVDWTLTTKYRYFMCVIKNNIVR